MAEAQERLARALNALEAVARSPARARTAAADALIEERLDHLDEALSSAMDLLTEIAPPAPAGRR